MVMSSDWGARRMWLNRSALTCSISSGADEAGFSRKAKKRSFFELRNQRPGIFVEFGIKRGALEGQPELPGGHFHHVNRALMEDPGLGVQQCQDCFLSSF